MQKEGANFGRQSSEAPYTKGPDKMWEEHQTERPHKGNPFCPQKACCGQTSHVAPSNPINSLHNDVVRKGTKEAGGWAPIPMA